MQDWVRPLSVAAGIPFGAGFWLVGDEALPTPLKFAPPPPAYPLNTHVRGLAAHLLHTGTTHGVCRLT
jgi:hypothetical protein